MKGIQVLRHGFRDLAKTDATVAHVAKCSKNYEQMIAYFGGIENIPSSVNRAERTKLDDEVDTHGKKRSYVAMSPYAKDKRIRSKTLRKMKYISGTGAQKGALSTFPQRLGRNMVLFYAGWDKTNKKRPIVGDPFAGHNSRMDLSVKAGYDYHGQDLNPEFMEHNRKRADQLREIYAGQKIILKEGDSRKLQFPSNRWDMSITSPPYWNLENYGKSKKQIGNHSYKKFLKLLRAIMRENFRCLKPGGFALYFVNDFVKFGKFIAFHRDTMNLGEEVGFEIWDMSITDYGRAQRDAWPKQCFDQKRLPKRHEYGIVFRKPLPDEE
jgi:DNA modification methylase